MEIFETKASNFFFSYLNQYLSTYTVLQKIETRLIDEMFASVMCEYVFLK